MASLPTKLLIDAARKVASDRGGMMTFLHTGDPDSGQILLVILDTRAATSIILRRERDWDSDAFNWVAVQDGKAFSDAEASTYIERQTSRDDDLWVIEFEGPVSDNPFV